MNTRLKGRAGRAFTLVEMVLNLTVLMLLMGGISSAILMASKAIPTNADPLANVTRAHEAAERIAADLYTAISFVDRTTKSVEFTVADRNSDNNPESILLEWSGTPGHPLVRQYSGGGKRTLVENVHDFQLDYTTETENEQPPAVDTESAPFVLASRDSALVPATHSMTNRAWIGQYFQPVLPVDALSWKVTEVRVMAKANGSTGGVTSVQLQTPTGSNLPSGTALESYPLYESSLTAGYAWQSIFFSQVKTLTPGSGLCLVLALQQNDNVLADVQYDGAGGAGRLASTNGGTSWSAVALSSMIFRVYGTYTAPVTPPAIIHTFLTTIGITLQIGGDPAGTVQTAVQILNRPELPLLEAL